MSRLRGASNATQKAAALQAEEPIADQKRSATHRRACPFA
jgi:hypothetical protein